MNPPIKRFDERRDIVIGGSVKETIDFCIEHFLRVGNKAIADHGFFSVALSGGSTPKAIFEGLCQPYNKDRIDWTKVLLFWGDERAVLPTDADSNYRMAMEAGLKHLPISKDHIFRMEAETDIEKNALEYEQTIREILPSNSFDLVMLGMGDDGHTASLFPYTHALKTSGRLVVGNYIPEKDTWRMTLTFECINQAKNIVIYVLGKNKASMVKQVFTSLYDPTVLPIQQVGTAKHKALWILDGDAAAQLTVSG